MQQVSNRETIALQKKFEHSEEHRPPFTKTFLDFVKGFNVFAKGIYETCDFFNFALIVVAVF